MKAQIGKLHIHSAQVFGAELAELLELRYTCEKKGNS